MADLGMLAFRFADAVRRRGLLITLRRITTTADGINPPSVVDLAADGTQASGATTLALRGSSVAGRLLVGDTITMAGQTFTATVNTPSRGVLADVPGFSGVAVTPPVGTAISSGTPATLACAADIPVYATIEQFARQVVDGQLIVTRRLTVRVPTLDATGAALPEPRNSWQMVVNGDVRSIQSAVPDFGMGGVIISWTLVAR
jgi:hypothetical protein